MADEPVRFTDLLHAIEGISQKMLTKNLRLLERDGIVGRTVHATAPVRIEYQLTNLGQTLLEPLARVRAWAVDHLDDILAAQGRYEDASMVGSTAKLNSHHRS